MNYPIRLAAWACIFVLIQLPERSYTNPYGYYGAYSRTRRDPTARNPAYTGMVQPNPVPMGPHGMANYGGHLDNQAIGRGESYGQDRNMYGANQYGAMDNSPVKPMMGRMDSTSQRGSLPRAGGASTHTDLNGYQSQSQSHYSSQRADQRQSNSPTPDGCSGVVCEDLSNCLSVSVNDTQCCPTCKTYGCVCQGYHQVYDCQHNGFGDGMVPERRSYTVAGNTTVCSCPPGGGTITCSFHDSKSSKCPELPPNCVKPFVRDIDGCDDCAMVGCKARDGTLVEEGSTKDEPPCSTCYCPPRGGELICGVDPACEAKISQQGRGTLAMESSIREINSLGHSSEANAYGGYAGYGAYPDYGNQFGPSNTGRAPVVPPVSPVGKGNGASTADTAFKGSASEGQRPVGESNGYNSYGPYQQGYNMGYQNQYMQYPSLGQGSQGYGGNFQGYEGYGYNDQYAQAGGGYPQQADKKSDSRAVASSPDGEKTTNEMGSQRNTDSYGYPMGGYDPYRQEPYVPPVVNNGGYPALGSQDATASDSRSKQGSSSVDTSSVPSDADSPSKDSQAGASSHGYPYDGYGQGRLYQSNYYGQYQGYNQFQPQFPVGNGADTKGSEESPKITGTGDDASTDRQSQLEGQNQQGYTGTFGQNPYGPYDSYGSYYGSQYAYPRQQVPAATDRQNGFQPAGQGSLDRNALPHDGARSYQPPSDASQGVTQNAQEQNRLPNLESPQQSNYPYSPYDQQQLYPSYPSQRSSQFDPENPPIIQPGTAAQGDGQPPSVGNREPQAISRENQQPTNVEATGSRRIRDNINVINKGRFTHEKPPHHPTAATTTTRPTTKTTKTTTRKPTKITTTTSPTTTTVATTTTTPPTTTTTRPTTPTNTDRKQVSLDRVLTGCCSRGRQWAGQHSSCHGISVMRGTYSHICSVAQEKCCLEAKQQMNCQQGMVVARNLSTCDVPDDLANTCGANEFKICCDCCEIGLKAVGLGMSCDLNIFGQQCNKAYAECCQSVTVERSRKTDPVLTITEATVTSPETPDTSGPRCSTHSRCQQTCDDTQDGMVCSCRRGYRLDKNRKDCVDVNECILNTHTCNEHQVCFNREGSFFCQRKISCGRGYKLTETNTCKDIDECELNIDDCLLNTDCENIRGSYRCIPKPCDKGFIADATGRCRDIDECRTRAYSCPRGSTCVNTEGSYVCRCPTGHTTSADNTECEDIDECASGRAECKAGSTCINTIGSFVCQDPPKLRCAPGYEADEDTRTCKDIDECSANTHTCKSGSTCINEHGSFRCQDPLVCPQGMEADEEGRVCLDVNECDDPSLHHCNVGGRCVNLVSTFKCVCDSGYENAVSETGLPTCKDVNECDDPSLHRCNVGGRCVNLVNSFKCVCDSGYENAVSETGLPTCKDVNECDDPSLHRCNVGGRCVNLIATFKCVCDSGHEDAVSDTGLPTCKDIDECATGLGDSCLHDCRNLPGKYECYCPSGYKMGEDGKTCKDIDECAQTESPCAGGETCFNTHGTFKCVDLSCPAGYTRITNTRKSKRCIRASCRGKPRSCLKQPKQISFHNISLINGTIKEKPLFRMSLSRSSPNDRHEFLITNGNSNGVFKVKSSTKISRPTGVVFTAQELIGPKDYVIDLGLKLTRGRRHSTYISRLYIFVGMYDM